MLSRNITHLISRKGPNLLSSSSILSSTSYLTGNVFHISKRSIFIQTEATPNPQSMKFIPQEKEVLPSSYGTGIHFDSSTTKSRSNDSPVIYKSPLVSKLFKEIPGVKSVFLGNDFITVTKDSNEQWSKLKPMIFSTIFDHYANDETVITASEGGDDSDSKNHHTDTTILETDDEVVAAIKELMETRVRPSVQEDGGDIFFVGFDAETGIVKVQLAGSCVGCPSSSVTLRNGVENMLMHYIPEVKGIAEVEVESGKEKDQPLKLAWEPEIKPE
jgi:Fe-S cluster biogenesis protein NfuA